MTEMKKEIVKNEKKKEIDLKEYYVVIKKRIWTVLIVAFITTVAGFFYTNWNHNEQPLYETSTRMIIGASGGDMKTILAMIKDPLIMEKVQKEVGGTGSPTEIAAQITILKVDDSQVIKLSVVDADPKMAMNIANATAEIFKQEIADILNFNSVHLLSAAAENNVPIPTEKGLSLKLIFVIGIVLGVGLVFLLDSLDDTIKRENEIEDLLGVPVVGVIKNMNKKPWSLKKKKKQRLPVRGEAFDIE